MKHLGQWLLRSPWAVGALSALLLGSLLGSLLWLSRSHDDQNRLQARQLQVQQAAEALRTHLIEAETSLSLGTPQGDLLSNREVFGDIARRHLQADPALIRMELRHPNGALVYAIDAGSPRPVLASETRLRQNFESSVALRSAVDFQRPVYARPYYVQIAQGIGFEVLELHVPVASAPVGTTPNEVAVLVAIFTVPRLLSVHLPASLIERNEVLAIEADGTLIARAGALLKVQATRPVRAAVERPGMVMLLSARTAEPPLAWVPSVLSASLVLLTFSLGFSGYWLWRHLQVRLATEAALREQHAFRKAMEDSLVTGLRARDLEGRTTYVNPAFCAMTGYSEAELIGRRPPMPYWISERREEHEKRYAQVLAGSITRSGYESEFQRANGERFKVLIFEAPLIDSQGVQTGWMGSVVDVTEIRRIEALNRKQLEQLQTQRRLSMLGEMASAMSHELNQPLGAITSYAAACENLLARQQTGPLERALGAIRQQSERAAHVIRSVQAFVKRREVTPLNVELSRLVQGLMPLIELQLKRIGARLELQLSPAVVIGDETLIEQVILNLTRNAVDAMQESRPEDRVLRIEIDPQHSEVFVRVLDRGSGVLPEVAEQLFSPFFSTKREGMGMGLSFCRSVIERMGGQLGHRSRHDLGTCFEFSMPVAQQVFEHQTEVASA